MKQQKEIERLTDAAKDIQFPKDSNALGIFRHRLSNLLVVNFGHHARDLRYDRDGGDFYWEDTEYVGSLKSCGVEIKRTYSLNPREPLAKEFERIAKEQEEFRETRRTILHLMLKEGGST